MIGNSKLVTGSIFLLLGVAPALTMALSWLSTDGPMQVTLKRLAPLTLVAEVAAVTLAACYCVLRRERPPVPPRPIGVLLILWLVVGFGTAIFSAPNPELSLIRTTVVLIHVSFAASVAYLIAKELVLPKALIASFFAGLLLTAVTLIAFLWTLPDPRVHDWTIIPGLDNIRRVGYNSAPIVALGLGGLATSPSSRWRKISFCVCVVGFALITWSGSRGAIMALAMAYLILSGFFQPLRARSALMAALAALAVGTGIGELFSGGAGMGVERMLTNNGGELSSGRLQFWQETLEVIARRPLLGYGEGQLAELIAVARAAKSFHPHNLLLQILLAWGVAGLLIVGVLGIRLIRLSWRVAHEDGASLPPLIAMTTILVYSTVDGTLFHVVSTSIFAACAGLMLGYEGRASTRPTGP